MRLSTWLRHEHAQPIEVGRRPVWLLSLRPRVTVGLVVGGGGGSPRSNNGMAVGVLLVPNFGRTNGSVERSEPDNGKDPDSRNPSESLIRNP